MATTFLAQNLESGKTGHCYTELEGGERQEDWLARVQGRAHKPRTCRQQSLTLILGEVGWHLRSKGIKEPPVSHAHVGFGCRETLGSSS